MSSDFFDPGQLPEFRMPKQLLSKMYEFTGSAEDNKGFYFVYVDQSGSPQIISHSSSPIVEMGLRKAMEEYLNEYTELIRPDIDPGEQDTD
jgi:hypothetical protein